MWGGLVDVWTSVQRAPGHFVVGATMSTIMDTFFDANPRVEEEILHAIGRDDVDPLKMESLVDNLRDEIARSIAGPGETIDQNRVNTAFYDTNVRAHLLFAWLAKANDPGLPICRWLWEGAPAGLTADFSCLDGLFPRVDAEEAELDPNDLVAYFLAFINYQGVEADDDVFNVLKGYRKRGFFRMFDTLAETKTFLQATAILTKVGSVKKLKTNPVSGQTKMKTRIIVDSKQAHTSKAAKRTHQSNLPTATGAARGFLGLMANTTFEPDNAGI